jgi:hypothetical protein
VAATLLHITFDPCRQLLAQERRATRDAEPLQELLRRERRPSDDLDVADLRTVAGIDIERQNRPLGIVFELHDRIDVRVEIASFREAVAENPNHVGGAPDRRRGAVAIRDGPPERADVNARNRGTKAEADPRHRMHGCQHVQESDAAVVERPFHRYILEAAQAEQLRD